MGAVVNWPVSNGLQEFMELCLQRTGLYLHLPLETSVGEAHDTANKMYGPKHQYQDRKCFLKISEYLNTATDHQKNHSGTKACLVLC